MFVCVPYSNFKVAENIGNQRYKWLFDSRIDLDMRLAPWLHAKHEERGHVGKILRKG